ncbi:hypothetical protein C8R42DRAFT_216138 [Lentinula raphanica]|nr:hypothetical protein C8R42DRAFT_216138 [Lentinula raphanica]
MLDLSIIKLVQHCTLITGAVVLHIPNQPALTTLSDHLFLSIGQYYFNVEHASLKVRQLARSERVQPAGSPGSGPKLLGYVRSLDPNAEYHAVQAAYSRVKDQKNGDPRILFTQLLNALSTQIGAFIAYHPQESEIFENLRCVLKNLDE